MSCPMSPNGLNASFESNRFRLWSQGLLDSRRTPCQLCSHSTQIQSGGNLHQDFHHIPGVEPYSRLDQPEGLVNALERCLVGADLGSTATTNFPNRVSSILCPPVNDQLRITPGNSPRSIEVRVDHLQIALCIPSIQLGHSTSTALANCTCCTFPRSLRSIYQSWVIWLAAQEFARRTRSRSRTNAGIPQ